MFQLISHTGAKQREFSNIITKFKKKKMYIYFSFDRKLYNYFSKIESMYRFDFT